jgi:hydroxymethylbilane synthase
VAVPERGDPRDVLVGSRSPTCRRAPRRDRLGPAPGLLADLRPDLTFVGLAGNIETRLAKAPSFAAIVMALAPLQRLGLEHHVGQVLEPHDMLPQVGQGALAIECRRGDDDVVAAVAVLDHGPSRRAVDAERGFLAALGGGCDLPVAAHATLAADGSLQLGGLLATFDGRQVLRASTEAEAGAEPLAVGAALAGRLLDEGGGRWLLAEAGIGPPA